MPKQKSSNHHITEEVTNSPKPLSSSRQRPLPVNHNKSTNANLEDSMDCYKNQMERHSLRKIREFYRSENTHKSLEETNHKEEPHTQDHLEPRQNHRSHRRYKRYDSEPIGNMDGHRRRPERRLNSESVSNMSDSSSRKDKSERKKSDTENQSTCEEKTSSQKDLEEYQARRDRRIKHLVSETHELDEEQRRMIRRQERKLQRSMSAAMEEQETSSFLRRKFSWSSRKFVSVWVIVIICVVLFF